MRNAERPLMPSNLEKPFNANALNCCSLTCFFAHVYQYLYTLAASSSQAWPLCST